MGLKELMIIPFVSIYVLSFGLSCALWPESNQPTQLIVQYRHARFFFDVVMYNVAQVESVPLKSKFFS